MLWKKGVNYSPLAPTRMRICSSEENSPLRAIIFVMKRIILAAGMLILSSPTLVSAFVQQWEYSVYEPAGFFSGIWHGLLAPWSLIARWVFDGVEMYAIANTGWFYDFGFLLGVGGSLPIGWIAAILSSIAHIFS